MSLLFALLLIGIPAAMLSMTYSRRRSRNETGATQRLLTDLWRAWHPPAPDQALRPSGCPNGGCPVKGR